MDSYDFDPHAEYDFKKDWTLWLDGDTIATSQWIVDKAGLEITGTENDAVQAVVWLGDWTSGSSFVVTNRITTAGGRKNDSSIIIKIRDK
jgi:hypothetical protein